MNFIEFARKYSTEESCKLLIKHYRDKYGIICKKCGCKDHYWQGSIDMYQCKECKFRTTLRSGTILESSKLSYQFWVYAIFLMTMTKKGISALELQRQLGHKRYEPIWAMMHKIRATMGNRDSKYMLDGVIELDDAFLKTHKDDKDDDEQSKRGRGSAGQTKVLVMAKVAPKVGRPKKHKKSSKFRYVKMQVISDSSAHSITPKVSESISSTSKVKSDGWRGFSKIKNLVNNHQYLIIPPKEASKVLPWVHTMISNTKRNLLGIYHNTKNIYLQNYLNEFCYKVNRRYFKQDIFERLMEAAVEDTWYGKLVYKNG